MYPYMFCLLYALPFCTRVCTHTSTHMHHGFLPVLCYGQEVFSLCLLKDKSQTLPRVFAFVDTTREGGRRRERERERDRVKERERGTG